MDRTPAAFKHAMHRGLDRILKGGDPYEARIEFEALASELAGDADRALETLKSGLEDAITVLSLPEMYPRRPRTTNRLERLIGSYPPTAELRAM